MFKNRAVRMIALLCVIAMSVALLASCGGGNNGDAPQLGVSGNGGSNAVGGNTGGTDDGTGDDANTPGNTDDAQTPGNTDDGKEDGTDAPGKEPAPGTPDGGNEKEDNSADDGASEEDPYAAMKADTSGTKIKILCQNLRCDATADKGTDNDCRIRRYRFQELVKKYDPDIIAGQECDAPWIQFLQEDYSNEYSMFYKYREGGNDEACPVLWKTSKYTKLNDGYFWLSKTPDRTAPSYESGQLPRIVNWVALKDKATGVEFHIFSTHFGFYKDENSIAGIRDQIAGAFAKVPKKAYAFVMGDLNFPYEEEQYYIFTDEVNITDLRVGAEAMAENGHCKLGDIRSGAYNGFKLDEGGVFGDFIMAAPRKHLAIDFFGYCYEKPGNSAAGVQPGFVSDHFAVYTEVRINTKVSYAEYYADSAV